MHAWKDSFCSLSRRTRSAFSTTENKVEADSFVDSDVVGLVMCSNVAGYNVGWAMHSSLAECPLEGVVMGVSGLS